MKPKLKSKPPYLKKWAASLLENGLFWMVLVLFTIGGMTTYYYQGTMLMRLEALKTSVSAAAPKNSTTEQELPVTCVKTDQPLLSLSFEVNSNNTENLRIITDTLLKHNIKATFFLTGTWYSAHKEEAASLLSQGHDLGNSGENHKSMGQLKKSTVKEELLILHNKIIEDTGYRMTLFCPPYSDYNENVLTTAQELGYTTVLYNVDSKDWKDYGVQPLIDTILNHPSLAGGSIVKLHTGAKYTPEALETIILDLQAKGYRFLPLSQLIPAK